MRRPSCGHDNRPELRFCTDFVSGLGRDRPSCGERAEALEHLDFAVGELRDMKMQSRSIPSLTSSR